jgi:hypothetical protein
VAGAGGGGDDLTRVGRWMSREEHEAMVNTGMVRAGRHSPQVSVAHPANVEAYMRQAAFSRVAAQRGLPPYNYPPASNIEWIESKIG